MKAAFFDGSPCSTAISAPLGRSGGASAHLISAALTDIASGFAGAVFVAASAAKAGLAASRANAIIVAKGLHRRLLGRLLVLSAANLITAPRSRDRALPDSAMRQKRTGRSGIAGQFFADDFRRISSANKRELRVRSPGTQDVVHRRGLFGSAQVHFFAFVYSYRGRGRGGDGGAGRRSGRRAGANPRRAGRRGTRWRRRARRTTRAACRRRSRRTSARTSCRATRACYLSLAR